MPVTSRYIFIAAMDVPAEREALFNEIYDQEHIPALLAVPGVNGVSRFRGESFAWVIGNEERSFSHAGPRYSTHWEIDHPAVLISRQWVAGREFGRWPIEIEPYLRNIRLALHRRL